MAFTEVSRRMPRDGDLEDGVGEVDGVGDMVVDDGSRCMELTNVRIVSTGRLRAVAFRAEGAEPEALAFGWLRSWAAPRGLLTDRASFLLLGRNDPPPTPGRRGYGYVYMLTINEGMEVGGVELTQLSAATYDVVRARLSDMCSRWEALYGWAEGSGYTVTGHGLEEHLSVPGTVAPDEMTFDLWLPVVEAEPAPN